MMSSKADVKVAKQESQGGYLIPLEYQNYIAYKIYVAPLIEKECVLAILENRWTDVLVLMSLGADHDE